MPRSPLPVGAWGRISRTQIDTKVWVARARFRDEDGRTRQVEARGESGPKAERALVEAMKRRVAPSGAALRPESRISYLLDLWWRTKIDGHRAINTVKRYRDVIDGVVTPGVGGLLIREATVGALDRFLQRTATERGAATAKLARTILSGAMALAVREGAAPFNPVRDVEAIASETKHVRALGAGDVEALRADLTSDLAAVSVDLHHLVDVMLGTGARIGEVLALRWQDVDLDEGTVTLSGTVVRSSVDGLVRQDTTKGKKALRLLLPPFALAVLERRAADPLPGGEHNLVFPSVTGGLREVSTVNKQWRKFRERHPRWEWVTPHTFRKTVGTAVERAADLASAAEQLGHSNEKVTRKHYVEAPTLGPDHRQILERLVIQSGE